MKNKNTFSLRVLLFPKKIVLLLCLIGLVSSDLWAQKKAPAVFTFKKDQNIFPPETGILFFKLGISNLLNPTAPSIDLGVEYMVSNKFSLEFVYGLRSILNPIGGFEKRLHFDQFYKLYGSLRFYPNGRGRNVGRIGKYFRKFHAFEGYYSQGKTFSTSNFALDQSRDDRIDYLSADVNKQVFSFNLKKGYIWRLSKKLKLETSAGLGAIFYKREYIFYTPNTIGQTFSEDLIGPYDDRNAGKVGTLNVIANAKLIYRIF